ncbi:LysR family transcriptional regulator [Desulfosporosinus orientis]|nr:LysR family transcriptional regulator [Desulfosporosinus orientis]
MVYLIEDTCERKVMIVYNPQLDTFIRVADAGSFSKAAENMYITPSAVIKQINLLENELGLQLFERTHRGLSLTEAGKSLYQDAKYIIQYCDESIIRAKNAMQKKESIIRIGTSLMTPPQFLVELWPKIHEHYPDLKFQFVPFENTPENAREILKNLGQNFDIVAGIFDQNLLNLRECEGTEISREPICCAVSVNHRLAGKCKLTVQDLYGENLMLIYRGWSSYIDKLRDDLMEHHSQIHIVDFDFYDVNVFNQCEYTNDLLMAIDKWENVHPLLKIIPVEWDYTMTFGILHSPNPSERVQRFLKALQLVVSTK